MSDIDDDLASMMKHISFFLMSMSCVVLITALAGCQAINNWQPTVGPTKKVIEQQVDTAGTGLTIIEIDGNIARMTADFSPTRRFSDYYRGSSGFSNTISAGDVVDVSIWEAPPALLFGTASDISSMTGSKEVKLPEQMVDNRGQITIPFVGKLVVSGKTPQQVQEMIVKGLHKKANNPSAVVRIAKNNSADITIIGEVNNSTRMPLTGKNERLLDAIAAAGGTKHPSSRVTIQLNRRGQSVEMPFEAIMKDPRQNVILQKGDVVSVNYQTKSFTVLGAVARNDEINFETGGISLMQALARAGGLNDNRADARGVFIFRQESINVLNPEQYQALPLEFRHQSIVPVIYRLNLKDPINYIVAQNFAIKDKDLIYVSNAPGVEFRKFVSLIGQGAYLVNTVDNLTN
ncbi:MAG: polysaccharide biosynthesis/export family protein [Moraxella sp.]|nr:polysaccharide biosynthesis/export family protein [Moraxella sp.]